MKVIFPCINSLLAYLASFVYMPIANPVVNEKCVYDHESCAIMKKVYKR